MLHLTNGDTTSLSLREAGVEGEIASIDDIMMEGPWRNALATPADLLHRAAWLQRHLDIPKADALAHAGRREKRAREAGADGDEVVLWSEEDLFCQVNLAHFLSKAQHVGRMRLAAPASGHVATLSADALRALLAARVPVTRERVETARRFVKALASPDPRAVEAFAREPTPAWPALQDGARLHLRRFPGARDGLGAIERALLRTVAEAPRSFPEIFSAYSRAPPGAYGIGDVQVLAALRAMAREPGLVFADDPRALTDGTIDARWALTDLGRDVLAGRKDALAARGAEGWLGGVDLQATPWRWDDEAERLRPAQESP